MTETGSKKRLLGKVAVVTGAGRGIGRSEAILLARQGAKVVVNDIGCDPYGRGRDDSIAPKVAGEIKGEGYEAVANTDTVVSMEGAGKVIDTAIKVFGRLDILINNAGFIRPGMVYKMSEEDWDDIINTHLKGHFNTIRHAAPVFREQRSGVIVNTSSEAGLGNLGQANYSAAKEGIVGLTRTVARDLGRFNVRCNAIRPFAETRLNLVPEALQAMRESEKVLGIPALGGRKAPRLMGEVSSPDQVATVVVWLCTEAAARINGRTLQVGNGEIGIYSEPEIIRSVFEPKKWDLDSLENPTISSYLIGDLTNQFVSNKT